MPSQRRSALMVSKDFSTQPWWPELHRMIIQAFQHKAHSAFPPTWTRLDSDASNAAAGLHKELGPYGRLAIIWDRSSSEPIACGGVTPFRGLQYINESSSTSTQSTDDAQAAVRDHPASLLPHESNEDETKTNFESWETCCICVSPAWRGKNLSAEILKHLEAHARSHGGRRLYTNYCIEETETYWAGQGYENIQGSESTLPQGWKPDFHPPTDPGLQHDIHFRVGVKEL